MPAQATLEAKGLWTNVNALSGAPPGSTKKQVNMRVHKPGLMTPRRGRKSIASLENGFHRIFDSGSFLVAFGVDRQVYVSSNNGVTWSVLSDWVGALVPVNPAWGIANFFTFNVNNALFFNTSDGIKTVSTTSGGYRDAGVPYGLNARVSGMIDAGTAIPPNSRVGYRAVFGLRNPSGQVELGAPSKRGIAINTKTGTSQADYQDAEIQIVVPPGIVAGKHFWQLYRTYPSPDVTADPGDEMSLVFEGDIPSVFSTVDLNRVDNVATINTSTAHGLAVGDVVNLDKRLEDPLQYFYPGSQITEDGANVGGVATYRMMTFDPSTSLYSTTNIQSGTFNSGRIYGNGLAHPANRRFLHSTQLGVDIFIHPNLSGALGDESTIFVYRTGKSGLWYKINTGTQIDSAAISADGTRLYVVSPPAVSTDLGDSYTNGLRFGVIDIATGGVQWINGTSPLAAGTLPAGFDVNADTMRSAFNIGCAFSTRWTDGVEYFVMQSVAVSNQAVANRTYYVNYYITRDFGRTWTTRFSLAAISPETVTITTPFFFKPRVDQIALADGRVRAFVGSVSPSLHRWSGTLVTAYTITGVCRGFSVRPDLSSHCLLYSNLAGNVRTIRNYTFGEPSTFTETIVTATLDSERVLMFGRASTNNNETYIDKLNTAGTVRTTYGFRPDTGVFTTTTITTAILPPALGQSLGVTRAEKMIFYAGSYVVTSVPSATSFTVFAPGPSTNGVRPYVASVNFNIINIIDNVAPGAVGPALYTSPSQEGISQANFPPPLARDIETFRGYGFYANATIQAYLGITLFSVGAATIDLNIGDFILIGNAWVEAAAAEDFANAKFKVTLDAGSAFENIRLTIESLSECVNIYADARHGCVLVKNEDTFSPGSMYIRSLYFDTNAVFSVRRGSTAGPLAMYAWSPAEPATVVPTQQQNIIYFSKPNQAGAVPLLNSVRAGSDSSPILRIKATREVLFVFKTEGIFAMRGYAPPWQVDPFDLSNRLMLPNALCQMDNDLFCATDHGIMKVSDSGIELISLPIQDKVEKQYSEETGQLSFSAERAFMFGDPSDHKLHLMLPQSPSGNPDDCELLVYDTYTNTWFQYGWNGTFVGSVEDETNSPIIYQNAENHGLYYKKTNTCIWVNNATVFTERKSYTDNDYVDDSFSNTILSWSDPVGKRMLVLGTPIPYSIAGSFLTANGEVYVVVSHPADDLIVVNRPFDIDVSLFPVDALFEYPVWTDVEYNCTYEVNAAALNHFREVNTLFKIARFLALRMIYKRPQEPSDISEEHTSALYIDGVKEFSTNGTSIEHFQTRTLVPKEQQRCSVLTVGFQLPVHLANNEIEGMTILFNPGPMRRRR